MSVNVGNRSARALLDTGSIYTLISANTFFGATMPSQINNDVVPFLAVNGSPIKCYGKVTVPITIADEVFSVDAYIADVRNNILGIEFLVQNNLTFTLSPDRVSLLRHVSNVPTLWENNSDKQLVSNASVDNNDCEPSDVTIYDFDPSSSDLGNFTGLANSTGLIGHNAVENCQNNSN